MSIEMTAGSESVASPEDVFERQAILAGTVTLMVAIFATCIGYIVYLVGPAFNKHTQSVEFANWIFVYGVFVLAIGLAFIRLGVSVVQLCDSEED